MIDIPPRARLIIAVVVGIVIGPAIMVGVPLYYWWYAPNFVAGYTDEANIAMFFGGFGALIGLAITAAGGSEVYGDWKRRKRFDKLVEGRRKSELMKNVGELEELARQLPRPYRERLQQVKEEHGID